MPVRLFLATLVATLLAAAPASAVVPEPPVRLPAQAATSAAGARDAWIVGARRGAAAARLARAHGATRIAAGSWEVPRGRARALASALERRGALLFAEPDREARRAAQGVIADPLSADAAWREAVAPAELTPPPVTAQSPVLALIDSRADAAHPEFGGGNLAVYRPGRVSDFHGTATAAVAAAPANGVGILGVWPGMRALNLPLPDEIDCADSARQIGRAVASGVSVINMSYGAPTSCFAEYVEIQRAVAAGISVVAAAGNEFASGNQPQYPASLPHVITVASVDPERNSSYFSNANAAVDVSAPGEGVLTAVPVAHDPDDVADGWAYLDGTSFAAPIAAAAVAWVRAARPELSPDQAEQVVRLSAEDLDREGYDTNTGFGLVRVDHALKQRAPIRDRKEPNEDIRWVNGSLLPRAASPIYRSGRSARVRGVVDRLEDPRDVYRIRVPKGRRLTLTLTPDFGDVDLAVHRGRATTVTSRRLRVAASARDGRRPDRVTVRGARGRSETMWVSVAVDDAARSLDSTYTLRVKRR